MRQNQIRRIVNMNIFLVILTLIISANITTAEECIGCDNGTKTGGNTIFGTPVPLSQFIKLPGNGYVSAGIGMRDSGGSGKISINLPTGSTIKKAYLYWSLIANSYSPSLGAGNINGGSFSPELIAATGNPCWYVQTYKIYNFRADVTNLVIEGDNILRGFPVNNVLFEGASLVVIYDNPTMPDKAILIYDGGVTFVNHKIDTIFSGFNTIDSVVSTTFIVADGQHNEPWYNNNVYLGDILLGQHVLNGAGPGSQYWDTLSIGGNIPIGSTSAKISVESSNVDCITWVAQVLSVSEVSNNPPIAEAGGPYTVDEGSAVAVDGSGSNDSDGDVLTYAWDLDNDGTYETPGKTATLTPKDGPAILTVGLQVSDGKGGTNTDTATINVNNVAPIIDSLLADKYVAPVDTAIIGTGTFHDPGILDMFTADWNWELVGDTKNLPEGSTKTTDSYTYTIPGVYSVSLKITDKDGGSDTENMSQYIVIYDPNGGFVTGGCWIDSPAGAYVPDPNLTGRANFGFVSKYQKGANTPTGQTEFQFHEGDLNFHSISYDWLVVAGAKAQYKGTGTINGAGNYGFLLTATDGQINDGGGVDKFRIKIVDKTTGNVVYDNVKGTSEKIDEANPQEIAGGSIVIHKQ